MIPASGAPVELALGFPRVSGDDPEAERGINLAGLFSPRERG